MSDPTPFPVFDAALTTHAGYGLARFRPTDRLNIEAGLRYEDGLQVAACSANKVELLRQLLAEDNPSEVEMLAPSLEDIYRHYVNTGVVTAKEALL